MIVTISREYGAAGLGVADGVARALEYELLADELPKAVAARLGTTPEEVAARAISRAPFPERMLGGLGAGTAEILSGPASPAPDEFDESVRREIERAIRETAARGDVVILGRNAAAVLGPRPDLVRVFLTAERAWRIERIVETFGIPRARAGAEVDRVDAKRRSFTRERYKAVWGDPHFYDLIVDTSRFGVEGAVEIVTAAVRVASAGRT
ncbi:MAG: cytidylate kinase-like family protein [Candidatus Baltobacteraceae bacterium]